LTGMQLVGHVHLRGQCAPIQRGGAGDATLAQIDDHLAKAGTALHVHAPALRTQWQRRVAEAVELMPSPRQRSERRQYQHQPDPAPGDPPTCMPFQWQRLHAVSSMENPRSRQCCCRRRVMRPGANGHAAMDRTGTMPRTLELRKTSLAVCKASRE